jgi:hypothetical protein
MAAIYSVFINSPPIDKIYATIPALFAKSSLLWPAILNVILQNKVRRRLFDDLVENGSNLIFFLANITANNTDKPAQEIN